MHLASNFVQRRACAPLPQLAAGPMGPGHGGLCPEHNDAGLKVPGLLHSSMLLKKSTLHEPVMLHVHGHARASVNI